MNLELLELRSALKEVLHLEIYLANRRHELKVRIKELEEAADARQD